MLGFAAHRVAVGVDTGRSDENPVDVIEATAHYAVARVTQVEGVAELVENRAKGRGQTAAVCAPVVAVVHQLLRVDERWVQESREDLRLKLSDERFFLVHCYKHPNIIMWGKVGEVEFYDR